MEELRGKIESESKERLTPEKRFSLLLDAEKFEGRVLELFGEEEKKEIEDLKNKLKWKKLPYKNLREFIDWLNHPTDASKESIILNQKIKAKIEEELQDILNQTKKRFDTVLGVEGYLQSLKDARGLPSLEQTSND